MKTVLSFFSRHLAFSLMAGIAVLVFALLAFDSAGMPKTDKTEFVPHVLCTAGTTVVKRADKSFALQSEKSADIFRGDRIRTGKAASATVFWTDGSVTRLSENTSIDVTELESDKKTQATKVDFSLNEGKTWSRVYRYLSDDSSFKERFDDGSKLAAVRGTAFEINADKGYLRTQSHSVDVTDPAGKLLSTVPEGITVNVKSLQSLINASLDAAWESSNISEDAKLSVDMARKAQEEVSARMKGLPVTASFSGGNLSVALSTDFESKVKNGQVAYGELMKAYEATAALPNTVENIRSKEGLRDAILASAPASEKARLATLFARHETYDSWAAAAMGDEEYARIRKKLREYVADGADEAELKKLESSLPKEKIEEFNSVMDGLKKKGFEGLSDPSLFMSPPKAVFDNATNSVKSALDSVEKLIPSIVR